MAEEKLENNIVDVLCGEEEPPSWLIPDLIAQGSFVTLVGESGAGKSVLAYTLAIAVASGCKAFSGLVPRGEAKRIIYFDDENSDQDRNKYLRRAWIGLTKANGKEPDLGKLQKNLWVVGGKLGGEDWAEIVQGLIEKLNPYALAYDTANACFNIEEENANSEAGKVIKTLKNLAKLTFPVASSIVIKHAKTRTEKGQIRTVRGAKIWKDQSDLVLFQMKAGGRPRRDSLSLTRLVPDKVRAYGLQKPIYITPHWTDDKRTGLVLDGAYQADKSHKQAEDYDEED